MKIRQPKQFAESELIQPSATVMDDLKEDSSSSQNESLVSFQTELPVPLQEAMTSFIERYPNWDQYRLIQAALAGFLVQNGVESRSITRLYIGNMFSCESLM